MVSVIWMIQSKHRAGNYEINKSGKARERFRREGFERNRSNHGKASNNAYAMVQQKSGVFRLRCYGRGSGSGWVGSRMTSPTITFGKHKGKRFSELPFAYLRWLACSNTWDSGYAQDELLRRLDKKEELKNGK